MPNGLSLQIFLFCSVASQFSFSFSSHLYKIRFLGLHGHILNFSFTSKIKDLLQMKKNCEPSTSIHLYEVTKLFFK